MKKVPSWLTDLGKPLLVVAVRIALALGAAWLAGLPQDAVAAAMLAGEAHLRR